MTTAQNTQALASRLVELCKQFKNTQAIQELYAPDVVSVEACSMPGQSATTAGKDGVLAKNQWWLENHEVHSGDLEGPFPHGEDRFALIFEFDVTFKPKSERMQMKEVGVYTVADGKIVREEFFYAMPEMG